MKLRIISIVLAICLALGLGTSVMAQSTPTPTPTVAKVEGTISSVDMVGNTVTITPNGGSTSIILNITNSTKIEVSGIKHATINDLKAGQRIEARYEVVSNGTSSINNALKIEAKTPKLKKVKIDGTISQIAGNLVTITPKKGNQEPVILTVTSNTKIEVAGEGRTTVASLRVGQRAEAQYQIVPAANSVTSYNNALKIEAKKLKRANIQGEITQITGNLVTITSKKGNPVSMLVTANTKIEVAGKNQATFADLAVGKLVEAQYEIFPAIGSSSPAVNYALNIEVKGVKRLNIQGEITGVTGNFPTNSAITITPKKGNPVILMIIANTKIEVSGKDHAAFTDLKTGQRVEAQYEVVTSGGPSVNNALKVEAHGQKHK